MELVGITLAMYSCAKNACIGGICVGMVAGALVGSPLACGWIGTIHNPVRLHLYPCKTMRPLCFTMHPILVNVTSHPALHNFTTESNECEARPGMMWPSRAADGSLLISRRLS